jgi:hypothetical protein
MTLQHSIIIKRNMKVTYKIVNPELENNGRYKKIRKADAIQLFKTYNWENNYCNISRRLEKPMDLVDSETIIFKNKGKVNLSIQSYDFGLYHVELFKEKLIHLTKIPQIIIGSNKLLDVNVVNIIQFFFDNDLESIKSMLNEINLKSDNDIGENSKKVIFQSNQFVNAINQEIEKDKERNKRSNQRFITYSLIISGFSTAYVVLFRYQENDSFFKVSMIFFSLLMVLIGLYHYVKFKRR